MTSPWTSNGSPSLPAEEKEFKLFGFVTPPVFCSKPTQL
jgi:hypothetical protein